MKWSGMTIQNKTILITDVAGLIGTYIIANIRPTEKSFQTELSCSSNLEHLNKIK